jgi:alkanesulfonate monooxygenase SsuD/methylene tetrahydromethanopterin reductase-like flavin-dependent oxidoreductase (luciferase family)
MNRFDGGIGTLRPGRRVHWGVMLAQGWKGELGGVSGPQSWALAQLWAQQAESLGFNGLWVFDHFQPYPARDGSRVLEAWTTLAALSQVTENIALGTLVSCAGYRAAGVTVKMAENLSAISGGRFCLGLGAGWDQPEYESVGVPFRSASGRSDELESVLSACSSAWGPPEHRKAPIGYATRPLVLVGGEGERRTLPAAAAHADVVNWQVGVDEFRRKSRLLEEMCAAAGRDEWIVRRTHATNFQLFDSERAFARWRQHRDRGMSSEAVYAYIRRRGALYGTASAIEESIGQFIDAGCRGFMVFCNTAPAEEGLDQLVSVPSVITRR